MLQPKKPAWLLASLGLATAGLVVYAVASATGSWRPSRGPGLAFGAAAALLVLGHALYPLRRRLLGFPFGNSQRWAQFHVYGGMCAFLFVLIHEDFAWPAGTMGRTLIVLSAWTAVSGLIAVWLQKWIPAMLTSGLQVECLFERIPELVERLRAEAAALVDGSSEMLERFYQDNVAPALAGVEMSWDYLLDVRRGRDRRLAPFLRLSSHLTEAERPRLEDLKSIFAEKLELDAQYSLQRILRSWIVLHVPAAMLLFGLALFHVVASLYYLSP